MKGYNLYSIFNLILSKLYTLFFHPSARLIRLPVSIRGSKQISFGSGFTTGRYCRIDALSKDRVVINIGDNCQINDSVHIASIDNVHIGHNVLIASRVFITDHDHGSYSGLVHSLPTQIPSDRELKSCPVKINDRVWLGEGVIVLPGVTIGSNSVIGANSVVTSDIPNNSIACGNPARVIKVFDEKVCKWIRV